MAHLDKEGLMQLKITSTRMDVLVLIKHQYYIHSSVTGLPRLTNFSAFKNDASNVTLPGEVNLIMELSFREKGCL